MKESVKPFPFTKVIWQLVTALDRLHRPTTIFLVARREPDLQRFVRSRHINEAMQSELPAHWSN